ncbi:MAG: ABC transporter ATP-binding protein [bacterium]
MDKLIEIKGLSKEFPVKKGFFNRKVGAIYAVNNVSFDIYTGETLGLVGESGCGKSTIGRCILGLTPITKGNIKIGNINITDKNSKIPNSLRKKMQIIFQNPYSSLNPRMTIEESLKEPLIIHKAVSKKQLNPRIYELLDMVGLSSDVLNRYPHEFSGGQKQRIVIARALALNPDFIIADEPVSALDVSIQAQIINLLEDLKKRLGLTYLFISHDLSIVRYVSNRVAVMYLGEIVELASVEFLYSNPLHPYTKALLSSIPIANPNIDISKKILIKGDPPSPANLPGGCKFHTRCGHTMDICRIKAPKQIMVREGHFVSCHLIKNS